jgi:hypothetical protein
MLLLQVCTGGKFHLVGNITVSMPSVFKKPVGATLSFGQKKCMLYGHPPLPRYIFSACCCLSSHCPNICKCPPEKILGGLTALCNCLVISVVGSSSGNASVADTCVVMNCGSTGSTGVRLDQRRLVGAFDGVHLTDA